MWRACVVQDAAGDPDRHGEGLSSAGAVEKDAAGSGTDSKAVMGSSCSRGAGTRSERDLDSIALGVQEAEGVRRIEPLHKANSLTAAAVCRTDNVTASFGVRHRT